jgi:hypothetical protein
VLIACQLTNEQGHALVHLGGLDVQRAPNMSQHARPPFNKQAVKHQEI